MARGAAPGQLGRGRLAVAGREVHRGNPEGSPWDRLAEVDPDAAVRAPAEGHVVVADALPDPDRGDPAPGSLDPPRREVRRRCPEPVPAEANVEVAVEFDPCVVPPDAEEHQDAPRPAAYAARKTNRSHRGYGSAAAIQ